MSCQRHCRIYKAVDGLWYLELARHEHGGEDHASVYGPFPDREAAECELLRHSNPGGHDLDDSGLSPVPTHGTDGFPLTASFWDD